ncbi:MAG: serine/threonine protein kinase [Selenomonadaceae bacterium]|nr:serine/threonine protein kinase [Selenomonadaceae bacterium]
MDKNIAEFIEFSYEKLTLLKSSGKGEVWLAKDIASGELVILKHVNLTGLPYGVIQNSAFRLPAKIFFFAESKTDSVVVEEYIRGESLSVWVEQKKFFSEDFAREILNQLCDGLKELHEHNIIHRDIKPSNLILQNGLIRLIDFDAARIFKNGQEEDTKHLGTKGYAPPEQYGSGQTDSRSDIYSLGVTMKTLLGENYNGRLKKILDKCVEFDPARRFKNVSELKRAVRLGKFSYPLKIFATIFLAAKVFLTFNHSADVAPPEEISKPVEVPEVVKTPEVVETPQVVEPEPEPVETPEVVESPQVVEVPEPIETPQVVETPPANETPEPEVVEPEPAENPPTLRDFKPSFPGKAPSSIEEFTPSFPTAPTFNPPAPSSDE